MPELDGISAARSIAEEGLAPVLLLTAYSDREFVDGAAEAGVMAYLVKPFAEAELQPAIQVALARHREYRALERDLSGARAELDDTREALETRKLVDRAKGVLMDSKGLKEAEAFRQIQKLSMNSRKSMREVAEAILLANRVGLED
jgi:response regulator NasT